jgi:hypothetical protein
VREHVIYLAPLAQVFHEAARLDPDPLPVVFLDRVKEVLDLDHRRSSGCKALAGRARLGTSASSGRLY